MDGIFFSFVFSLVTSNHLLFVFATVFNTYLTQATHSDKILKQRYTTHERQLQIF